MKRNELKKQYREILASDYSLRCAIGLQIGNHQHTIQRWAVNNNPKLCTDHFLSALRKHAKISKSTPLIDEVTITQAHDLVA